MIEAIYLTEQDILANNVDCQVQRITRGLPDGWSDDVKLNNFQRLSEVARHAKSQLKGASVLDIGCGTGDLAPFLRDRGVTRYLGIDLYQPQVEMAQEKHPGEEFLVGDFLRADIEGQFDFAFLSGAMTVRLNSNNIIMAQAMIKRAWGLTEKGVAFNFLTEDRSQPQPTSSRYFHDPLEMARFCRNLAPNSEVVVSFDHTENDANFYIVRGTQR